jgi:predicted RND superfamily exporter protein
VNLFSRFVAGHPIVVLVLVALGTLLALQGIVDLRSGQLRLTVDPGIDRLLPSGDEQRRFYDRARELFGSDQTLLLVLEAEDVFQPDALAAVQRITQRVERIPGVERVLSLASAAQIEDRAGDIYAGPFFEEVPGDAATLARLRASFVTHPIYRSLVTSDGRATSLLLTLGDVSDREFARRSMSEEVLRVAQQEAPGATLSVTGLPHAKLVLSRTILAELAFIAPCVLAISALVLLLTFRTLRGVVLPMLGIAISVIWTVGGIGWSGMPLDLVSNIVPPLVVALSFAAMMHITAEYYELLHQAPAADRISHRRALEHVLNEMGLVIAVNGFTTVLGFLSLLVSQVPSVRQFGLWASVGVALATLISLTLIPALLSLLGPPRRLPRRPGGGAVDRGAERLADFDLRWRRGIFAFALAVLVLCCFGIARLRISTGIVDYFFEDAPVRVTFDALNERLGGLGSFFVVIEADEDGAFARPANLQALRELQLWLAEQPEIGHTLSLADPLMQLHQAFHENRPEAFRLPERQRLAKQLLLFGGEDVSRGLVDANHRTANIVARTTLTTSEPVGRLIERIEARLEELPGRLRGRVTGDLVLLRHSADSISWGQVQSLGTALFTIYLTLALLLTSFRVALFALVPNVLPIAVYYGMLGLADVPLSLSTSLIGAITLGIAVDDTVHYFARFAIEARRLGDERQATVSSLRSVIRPVTATTLGLCLGFLVFATSELRYQVQFGLLSAFTMAVGWALELTLSPAICSRIRLVTLWDLLRIDLGPEPQRSIPLFAGLSARQARIFALMSRIVSVRAGQRLFGEGDRGREMFVVIDGELVASRSRNGTRVEFSHMRRGDVVGEVALFSEGRTADVDVAGDARLLRFDDADLVQLGRRYPRIAVEVNRNLNRVLASRVVSTAQALGG